MVQIGVSVGHQRRAVSARSRRDRSSVMPTRGIHMLRAALLIAVLSTGSAVAETRRYYDAAGHPQGRSETQGNLTRFYDKDGRPTGRSETSSSGIVRHYDKDGHPQGETR